MGCTIVKFTYCEKQKFTVHGVFISHFHRSQNQKDLIPFHAIKETFETVRAYSVEKVNGISALSVRVMQT